MYLISSIKINGMVVGALFVDALLFFKRGGAQILQPIVPGIISNLVTNGTSVHQWIVTRCIVFDTFVTY
jgi:hypothetical protein